MSEHKKDVVWETLSHDEKNDRMIQQEKELLDTFLERNAITREEYEKAVRVLEDRFRKQ